MNELWGLGAEARAGRRDRASRKMGGWGLGAEAEEGGASRKMVVDGGSGGAQRRRLW